MRAPAAGSVCLSVCVPCSSLFDCWENLGETCVEIAVEEAFVTSVNEFLSLVFELICWYRSTLCFQNACEEVFDHRLGFHTDKCFVTMHLVIVALLDKFDPFTIEGVEFDAIDIGPVCGRDLPFQQ